MTRDQEPPATDPHLSRGQVPLHDGVVDLVRRVVRRSSGEERLTAMEARLVSFLARHPGLPFDKDQLHAEVWGYRQGVRSRTAISTIQRLRKKLEIEPSQPRHLITEPGGYLWRGPVIPAPTPGSATPSTGSPPNRHALPIATTPFVGRDDDVARLSALLGDGDARLVTVVGAGGMGKTRLAVEVARALTHPPVAVTSWFVPSASLATRDDVVSALALAAGVPSVGAVDLALVDALERQPTLVVFDNVEQVEGAARLVQELIERVPTLRILCTSRVSLGLTFEHVYRVEGLAFPHEGTDDDVVRSDAGQLFADAASRARPGFATHEHAGAVRRIVELVEGMPLALVLAASWLRLLRPEEVADEIQRGLDLLESDFGDLDPRHRSVRATLQGSLTLLDDKRRTKLVGLSSLRGPFEAAAAAAVAGASLPDLLRLVDVSLVRRNDGGRFELHPLVGEFLRERLALAPAQRAAVEAQRYAYFRERAVDASARLLRMQSVDVDRLRADLADLTEVWREALARVDVDGLCALLIVFYAVWESQFVPTATLLGQSLAEHAVTLETAGPRARAVLAMLQARAGLVFPAVGRVSEAEAAFADAVHLLEDESGDALPPAEAFVSLALAQRLLFAADHEAGHRYARRIMELDRTGELLWFSTIAEGLSAVHAARLGSLDEARTALAHLEGAGPAGAPSHGVGRHLASLALAFWFGGEHEDAARLGSRALDILSDDPDRGFFSLALGILAHAQLERGQLAEARQAVREAMEEHLAHEPAPVWLALALVAAARLLLLDEDAVHQALADDLTALLLTSIFPPLVRELTLELVPRSAPSATPRHDLPSAYTELLGRLADVFEAV